MELAAPLSRRRRIRRRPGAVEAAAPASPPPPNAAWPRPAVLALVLGLLAVSSGRVPTAAAADALARGAGPVIGGPPDAWDQQQHGRDLGAGRRRRRGKRSGAGGEGDKAGALPPNRDENHHIHGNSGLALGESEASGEGKASTYLLQMDCGLVRSGPFLRFQNRDWDEHETGEVTTVVPFYGLRYAASMADPSLRWTPPQPAPCPFLPEERAAAAASAPGNATTTTTTTMMTTSTSVTTTPEASKGDHHGAGGEQPPPQPQPQAGQGQGQEEGRRKVVVYDAGSYREACVQADGSGGLEDCLFINVFAPLATLKALEGKGDQAQQKQHSTDFSSPAKEGGGGGGGSGRRRSLRHRHHHHHHAGAAHGNKGLHSNASSPSPSPSTLLPVVVYIHGGGLMMGASRSSPVPAIAGDRRFGPVVAVSIDHRLNVFGFLALRELSEEQGGTSGNYGLLDQQEALRWVQKHIRSFGGDPDRVTVIGHSSGGTSIFALLASPASKGLFHRAISLSGSPNVTLALAEAEQQNAAVLHDSPCTHLNGTEARLRCLRSLPVPTLLGLMPANWSTPGLWELPVGPQGQPYGGLPIVDGKVVTHSFHEALAQGVVDVPFMLGNMGYEPDCCTTRDMTNLTFSEWSAALQQHFMPWGGPEVGAKMAQFYATEVQGAGAQKALSALMSDYGLICGAAEAARAAAASSHFTSPVYLFVNNWGPATPLPRDPPAPPMTYAFHGWDLTSWLRDYPTNYTAADTDLQHSRLLRQAFYQFAVQGHLNDASGGSLAWAPVDATPGALGTYLIQPSGGAGASPSGGAAGMAGGSGVVLNYKADVCEYFRQIGLWQPFWWAD